MWSTVYLPAGWSDLGILCSSLLTSFPGLSRFFCSSVSVDNNTRMRKGGLPLFSPPFCIRVLIINCQRKPKNRKNGVGLGMRLHYYSMGITQFTCGHSGITLEIDPSSLGTTRTQDYKGLLLLTS